MMIHIVLCVSIFFQVNPYRPNSSDVLLVAAQASNPGGSLSWGDFSLSGLNSGFALNLYGNFKRKHIIGTWSTMMKHQEFGISIHIRPYIWWIISQTSPIFYKDMFVGARASARRTAVMRPGACRNHQRRAAVGWELLQERFGPGGNPKCWDLVSSSGDFESGVILGGNMLKSSKTFFSVQVFTQDRCCKWCKMYIKWNNIYNKCKDNWWKWKYI